MVYTSFFVTGEEIMKKLTQLLLTFLIICLCTGNMALAEEHASGMNAKESLQKLIEGNNRYVTAKMTHPNQSAEKRTELTKGQKPFAIILSCSDSRVPPEVIFDQGLGDLFIIRDAGNIIDNVALGSIEYAVEHLGTPLIMVLGHKKCGAVTAATKGEMTNTHIDSIIEAIKPAVDKNKGTKGDIVDETARTNVKMVIDNLKQSKPVIEEFFKEGKVSIVGGYYDLDSGKVEIIYP